MGFDTSRPREIRERDASPQSTIDNHSSSLLRREENSDQVNQDSDKPAFGKPMQGSKVSDSVGLREKLSNQFRETVATTIFWCTPSQQAGNRCLLERLRACFNTFENRVQSSGKKHSNIHERNPEERQILEYNSWISSPRKDIPWCLASPKRSRTGFDIVIKMDRKKMEQCIGMRYSQH